MICPKCGQNVEDSGFCPFCGFEFSKENIQNVVEQSKIESEMPEKEVKENNFPLSPTGRIKRLPYITTKVILLIICIAAQGFKSNYFDIYFLLMLIVIVGCVCAASKRLRDIKWSQWAILIWLIPFVGIVVGAPLLFIKSKYDQ